MKKNYFLTLLAVLFMTATASAADDITGIYKLTGLSAGDIEALGDIDPNATFRIIPGDGIADYYLSGVAGFGARLSMTYDAGSGNISATDAINGMMGGVILYFSSTSATMIDASDISLSLSDNVLTISDDIIVIDGWTDDVIGIYNRGITLTKQTDPTPSIESLVGTYTFNGQLEDFTTSINPVEYTMTVTVASDNELLITGLFNEKNAIKATYIPEAAVITIPTQMVGSASVSGGTLGDPFFEVSENEWTFNAALAYDEYDVLYPGGKAVKTSSSAIETAETETATVYASNGVIYVKSNEPAAVQIYNISGVQVYANPAVTAPITTLPHGIYFVKVAGCTKAVAVKL